ncbi:MAG: periplasmic heavy metal sensor [Acidobacteriota bacterium]|nr:periplasmic heavy metal sensor [Acidobacteriota bacterium]
MNTIQKGKWQVRVAALLIFVIGFAAGALALNVYKRWGRTNADQSRQDRFERMLDRLNLNADQKTQVHQILSDSRGQLQTLRKESEPRFEEIRRQADERLQKVLTPEQWQQFQKERSEMRGRGRRRN